ncbi:TetR-like C-terminal domain-containing protein [Paractinoplanes maris]|uniref:TetR-like C-terminal domain-containing protein n=1 Tax=Paractinoplanes maris TaxID=1734446 RepID=UPI0020229813|nr:TetR-like C-terminal domain-containing protein [Actinoplanes maris]
MNDPPELDPDTEAAVVNAVEEVFQEWWTAQMSFGSAVAQRMGMSFEEFHRLCPQPEVVYAEVQGRGRLVEDVADLGDTRTELFQAMNQMVGFYSVQSGVTHGLLRLVLNVSGNDVDGVERLRQASERRWREIVTTVLERGIVRGDLPPDVDTEAIVDVLAAAVTYHSVFGTRRGDWSSVLRTLLDMILTGVAPLREPEYVQQQPVIVPPAVERAFRWLDEVPMGAMLRAADVSQPLLLMTEAPQEKAVLGDCPVTVSVFLNRDFSLTASHDPLLRADGNKTRLSAGVRVVADKPHTLPPHLRADRIVVVHGDEVWVAPLIEGDPPTLGSQEFSAGARLGPTWGAGSRVDVVVRLRAPDGTMALIRLIDQVIETTM